MTSLCLQNWKQETYLGLPWNHALSPLAFPGYTGTQRNHCGGRGLTFRSLFAKSSLVGDQDQLVLEQTALWAVSFWWPYTWVLWKESQREYCGGDELCWMQELGQEPSLEAWVMQCPRMACILRAARRPPRVSQALQLCCLRHSVVMATGKCCPHVAGGAGPVEWTFSIPRVLPPIPQAWARVQEMSSWGMQSKCHLKNSFYCNFRWVTTEDWEQNIHW